MPVAFKLLLSLILMSISIFPIQAFANIDATILEENSPLNVEIEDTNPQSIINTKNNELNWESTTENKVNTPTSIAQKFSDIGPTHWARNEIYHMHQLGLVNGYPDGEFRANSPITRGQAANMMTTALQLEKVNYKHIFKDVSKKSIFSTGALATYQAKIFLGKPDGTFGIADQLTQQQLATTIVRALNIQDTGESITFNDWETINQTHRNNVKILAQHKIISGNNKGNFEPNAIVSRATFTIWLYRALVSVGNISNQPIIIEAASASENFKPNNQATHVVNVTTGKEPIMLRSNHSISFVNSTKKSYDVAKDTIYQYNIDGKNAKFILTIRTFSNGSQFVFSTLKNSSTKKIKVDVFQITEEVTAQRLVRFDRYKIKGSNIGGVNDFASTPIGVLQLMGEKGHLLDRMIGKAYRSRQLTQTYHPGGQSVMRELYAEYENFSYIQLENKFYSFYHLTSAGQDIVDSWYVQANEKLFTSDQSMDRYMHEFVVNFKKRNKWYTSQGPYNQMAATTEPMPKSQKGYGRNLLLIKEDRALELLLDKGDLYYETIVMNGFVNLINFKGTDKYWHTEVTSTYLKNLYNITTPFVDTRFNEQIALYYYRGGKVVGIKNYTQPLKNYANLLVEQVRKGNITRVNSNAYYIPDYFPVYQSVTTHTSMNHLLGGISILLHAYEEFGLQIYLDAARAQMNAIDIHKTKWIRANGDIWYKIDPNQKFSGTDYVHLTLEDLTYSYYLWRDIDPSYLPLLESLIASKASYLKNNNKGSTEKIKIQLQTIDMLHYLP